MTVIAWDGKTLAADKRAVNAGLSRTVTKIRRMGKLLVGASGNASASAELFEWVKRGRKEKDFPKIQSKTDDNASLLVIDHGRILKYEVSPIPIIFEDKFFAMGSGRDYALAAMFLGKDAVYAVQIACLFDVDCGNGIDLLNLE